MNGNENNNNQGQEGFKAVSLGNIENQALNVPNPPAPVNPIVNEEEVLDTLDANPVNNEIPMETPINEVPMQEVNSVPVLEPVAPVSPEPISYDIPEVIDSTPIFNDIGTVPPIPNGPIVETPIIPQGGSELNPKEKKKGMNKTLFVVIILLLLCAVGGGVYVILHKANFGTAPVVTKNVKIEIGSDISTNIKDYAVINKKNLSCSLDTSDITDTNQLNAKYQFHINCGDKSYVGHATIVDTVAPVVQLQEVTIGLNGTLNPEDFIVECEDATKCSYEFKDSVKVSEYIKEASSYHVSLIIKDEGGNKTEATGTLIVTESAISSISLSCSKSSDNYEEIYQFGLNKEMAFDKNVVHRYTFNFDNKEDYDQLKNDNQDKKEMTYQNITGVPSFNDDDKTLVISIKVDYDEIKKEVNSDEPSVGDLKGYYQDKDYVCGIK